MLSLQCLFLPGVREFRALAALSVLWLGGCSQGASDVSRDPPNASDAVRAADLRPRYAQATRTVDTGAGAAAPMSFYGTPVAVEPAHGEPTGEEGKDGFALNFDNTPVGTVAKVVLGDILGVGYVLDPRAQGTISLSSGRPIAKKDMLFVLENALRANGLILVRDTVGYRILPGGDGTVGAVDRADANGAVEAGYGMTVIPVDYVSGQTLVKLMEGFATKPGAIRTDPSGKLLLVLGSGAERQSAIDTARNFDVDWLRGQSVGIYPIRNSAPEPVVEELEKIMDSGEAGLGHNLVKFQAIARQNAIMVVAAKPELLRTAAIWVSRLDSSAAASTGVKVYRVKYGEAKQIAALLTAIFQGGSASTLDSAANQIAPASGATALSAAERLTGGPVPQAGGASGPAALAGLGSGRGQDGLAAAAAGATGAPPFGGRQPGGPGADALPGVRITPDVANNAILIYADQQNYRIIERALAQLDRPKLQVAIDVTIAEVTLNDDLSYGVQFFLSNKLGSLINSTGTAPPLSENLPGFNLVVGNSTTPHAIISALHQYTDVKILSNPSLVVVDNQPATLEVGDQVPVSTGTATVLSANNSVVSTVDYKNTGIILHVLPRVNSNGTVLLDIEQEISSVPNGGNGASTNANLTPTISERKVKSELSVASGQTVLLAGLVSENQNVTHSGIPVLDQIPGIGPAFSSNDKSIARTELILFIRPQIIRDGADASVVAEELRSKMRGGEFGSLGLPKLFAPEPKRTLQ